MLTWRTSRVCPSMRRIVDFPFWNAVFLTESSIDAAQLESRLREAAVYVRQKRHAGLIYVCEEYLTSSAKAALPSALREARLELSLPVHGMAGNILPRTASSHPALQMRRVTDEAQLMVYADINCEGYGFPSDWGRTGLRGSRLWIERAYSYLGYEGDHPVCAASAIAHDGNLYLALVATRPNAQRKGYGEAVVRHALQSAHDGHQLSDDPTCVRRRVPGISQSGLSQNCHHSGLQAFGMIACQTFDPSQTTHLCSRVVNYCLGQ